MPPEWPKTKEGYDIHERASPEDWVASRALTLSTSGIRKAQYNPLILDHAAIEALELYCIEHSIEHGLALTDLNDETRKQHNFWMDCREYLRNQRVVVGYCDGQKVHHIFVKWTQKGFHGFPATVEYLRSKGARP